MKGKLIWIIISVIFFVPMLVQSKNPEQLIADALLAGLAGGFSALLIVLFFSGKKLKQN